MTEPPPAGDAPSDPSITDVRAALVHWRALASFAWDRYLALGRGVVVTQRESLLATNGYDADTHVAALDLSFVPVDYVPKGDDFLPLMRQYDPTREVLLVLIDAGGNDRLLRLQCDSAARPSPEECWRQSPFADSSD